MVDVAGHLGMALVWLAPAWLRLDRPETAATFVGVGAPFGMLPDVDLYVRRVLPTVKHHGVFHTVLVVTVLAATIGPLVGRGLDRTVGGSDWFSLRTRRGALGFGFLAVWVAGLSHLFADVLSAPDAAEAIEPFWPIFSQVVAIDVVWYSATWFNYGLLVAGIGLNAALFYWRSRSPSSAVAG